MLNQKVGPLTDMQMIRGVARCCGFVLPANAQPAESGEYLAARMCGWCQDGFPEDAQLNFRIVR
eukprot:3336648-Pyramimonas_sp.AAC.1